MTSRHARDAARPAVPGAGDDALARLLAAAAAPGTPDELVGMSKAVTAFAAHHSPRRSKMPAFLAALVATKTALAATAATAAVGAVTLAGATGTLPDAAQDIAHDVFGAPASGAEEDRRSEADEKAENARFVGLCRAYQAGAADNDGEAADSKAFSLLVTAAGGAEGVDAFCVNVLADAPGRPADAGKPADVPTGKPADAGKPADVPAGKPADVPTGKPADVPAGKPADAPAGRPNSATAPAAAPDGQPEETPGEAPEDTPAPDETPTGRPAGSSRPAGPNG